MIQKISCSIFQILKSDFNQILIETETITSVSKKNCLLWELNIKNKWWQLGFQTLREEGVSGADTSAGAWKHGEISLMLYWCSITSRIVQPSHVKDISQLFGIWGQF